ncbi:ABC transporter permease, partial [Pseudomonas sp. BGM005]|nr:ABC transporter permease [Pseudomonas sp. BG5]
PGIARGGPGDGAGGLAISREVVVPVDVRAADGVEQTLSLRGMDPAGPAMRERARLSEGRPFVPGGREIVVGARLADAFP